MNTITLKIWRPFHNISITTSMQEAQTDLITMETAASSGLRANIQLELRLLPLLSLH